MALHPAECPEAFWSVAHDMLPRFLRPEASGAYVVGSRSIGKLGLAMPTRVAWLRRRPVMEGKSFGECAVFTEGWRFLLLGDGKVVGALSIWSQDGSYEWTTHWGTWATAISDALLIAEQRRFALAGDVEPVFLRVRSVPQAALWFRSTTRQGEEAVIPLPDTVGSFQSLSVMTPESFTAEIRRLLTTRQTVTA